MTAFTILKFAASFLCLELALVLIFLFSQQVGRRRDLYFSYICFCGAWYFFSGGMTALNPSPEPVLFWTKMSLLGIIPLIAIYPLFLYEFAGMRVERWVSWALWISVGFAVATPTDLMVKGVTTESFLADVSLWAVRQPLDHLFLLCFAGSLTVATVRTFPRWGGGMANEPMRLIVRSHEFRISILLALGCALNDILVTVKLYHSVSLSPIGMGILCVAITYRILYLQGWLYRSLKRRYVETITTLARMLDAKDGYTAGHSERVGLYSDVIAEGMGLPETEQEIIYRAALLHDIGKIAIPDQILRNPLPLSEEEWEIMKSHAQKGREILSSVVFLLPEIQMAFSHHERYDGKGYPQGLKGEGIPLGAQIIALADAFDAMTSHRAYRRALPLESVIEEVDRHTGTQFAPRVVEAFKRELPRILALKEEAFARQGEAQKVQTPHLPPPADA